MLQPHIQLDDTLNIKYAILPGDPGRLDRIALQLQNVEELAYNREFRSLRGLYKGVPVLAISTGIGGSSAAIAIEASPPWCASAPAGRCRRASPSAI